MGVRVRGVGTKYVSHCKTVCNSAVVRYVALMAIPNNTALSLYTVVGVLFLLQPLNLDLGWVESD